MHVKTLLSAVVVATAALMLAPTAAHATEDDRFPYVVSATWQVVDYPTNDLWPQVLLSRDRTLPAATCVPQRVQFDDYWIRDAEDEAYWLALNGLSSPADDARLEPHNWSQPVIPALPADDPACAPTPTPTPTPTATPQPTPTATTPATPSATPSPGVVLTSGTPDAPQASTDEECADILACTGPDEYLKWVALFGALAITGPVVVWAVHARKGARR